MKDSALKAVVFNFGILATIKNEHNTKRNYF